MRDASLLGPWIRRFLMEHMISERNLARNTPRSYRDTLRLLLLAIARRARKPVDRLAVTDLSADRVRQFLNDLEEKRGCAIATRNQRLAAIRALARFIGLQAPELVAWCGQVRMVPFKKAPRALVPYLEKAEMDALLAAPDNAGRADSRHSDCRRRLHQPRSHSACVLRDKTSSTSLILFRGGDAERGNVRAVRSGCQAPWGSMPFAECYKAYGNRMSGSPVGKSFVLRVIKMESQTFADAQMTASGSRRR